jgi:hypothetical protein
MTEKWKVRLRFQPNNCSRSHGGDRIHTNVRNNDAANMAIPTVVE